MSFVGFDAFSSSSSAPPLDEEFTSILKSLRKKDIITKRKSLTSLSILLNTNVSEASLRSFLPLLLPFFDTFVWDMNMMEKGMNILCILYTKIPKKMKKEMKGFTTLMGFITKNKSTRKRDSGHFDEMEKCMWEMISNTEDEIVNEIMVRLTWSPEMWKEHVHWKKERVLEKRSMLVCTMLNGFNALLQKKGLALNIDKNMDGFWNLVKDKDDDVRQTMYISCQLLMQHYPHCVHEDSKENSTKNENIARCLLGAWSDKKGTNHTNLFAMILQCSITWPFLYTYIKQPLPWFFARLWSLMDFAFYGSGDTSYPSLLTILAHLPEDFIAKYPTGASGLVKDFTSHYWKGYSSAHCKISVDEFFLHWVQCLQWILANETYVLTDKVMTLVVDQFTLLLVPGTTNGNLSIPEIMKCETNLFWKSLFGHCNKLDGNTTLWTSILEPLLLKLITKEIQVNEDCRVKALTIGLRSGITLWKTVGGVEKMDHLMHLTDERIMMEVHSVFTTLENESIHDDGVVVSKLELLLTMHAVSNLNQQIERRLILLPYITKEWIVSTPWIPPVNAVNITLLLLTVELLLVEVDDTEQDGKEWKAFFTGFLKDEYEIIKMQQILQVITTHEKVDELVVKMKKRGICEEVWNPFFQKALENILKEEVSEVIDDIICSLLGDNNNSDFVILTDTMLISNLLQICSTQLCLRMQNLQDVESTMSSVVDTRIARFLLPCLVRFAEQGKDQLNFVESQEDSVHRIYAMLFILYSIQIPAYSSFASLWTNLQASHKNMLSDKCLIHVYAYLNETNNMLLNANQWSAVVISMEQTGGSWKGITVSSSSFWSSTTPLMAIEHRLHALQTVFVNAPTCFTVWLNTSAKLLWNVLCCDVMLTYVHILLDGKVSPTALHTFHASWNITVDIATLCSAGLILKGLPSLLSTSGHTTLLEHAWTTELGIESSTLDFPIFTYHMDATKEADKIPFDWTALAFAVALKMNVKNAAGSISAISNADHMSSQYWKWVSVAKTILGHLPELKVKETLSLQRATSSMSDMETYIQRCSVLGVKETTSGELSSDRLLTALMFTNYENNPHQDTLSLECHLGLFQIFLQVIPESSPEVILRFWKNWKTCSLNDDWLTSQRQPTMKSLHNVLVVFQLRSVILLALCKETLQVLGTEEMEILYELCRISFIDALSWSSILLQTFVTSTTANSVQQTLEIEVHCKRILSLSAIVLPRIATVHSNLLVIHSEEEEEMLTILLNVAQEKEECYLSRLLWCLFSNTYLNRTIITPSAETSSDSEEDDDEEATAVSFLPPSLQDCLEKNTCLLGSESDVTKSRGTLLVWNLFLDIVARVNGASQPRLRASLGAYVQKKGLLKSILEHCLELFPLSDRSPQNDLNDFQQRWSLICPHFTTCDGDMMAEGWSSLHFELAEGTFFTSVQLFPALCRTWWNDDCSRHGTILALNHTVDFVSPLLIQAEVQGVENVVVEDLTVRGSVVSKAITATYLKDECALQMVLRMPDSYPLRAVEVECTKRLGVSEDRWNRWVLQILKVTNSQDGTLLDAVMLWKKNVDKEFEGVEPCPICYSILHPKTHGLPRLTCGTCKNKYHSACLYKWFNQSGKSKCPVCQQPFN